MSDMWVKYDLLAPKCDSCGRDSETLGGITLSKLAKPMLEAAGFDRGFSYCTDADADGNPIVHLQVADHMERVANTIAADAVAYSQLVKAPYKWETYGRTLDNLRMFAKECRKLTRADIRFEYGPDDDDG